MLDGNNVRILCIHTHKRTDESMFASVALSSLVVLLYRVLVNKTGVLLTLGKGIQTISHYPKFPNSS